MLILGQHIRMDRALDWRQEDRVFSSLPSILGITFREHSPLPAFLLLCCPVLCTLWGTESRPVLPLGHRQESFGYTLKYPLFSCTESNQEFPLQLFHTTFPEVCSCYPTFLTGCDWGKNSPELPLENCNHEHLIANNHNPLLCPSQSI